MFRIVNLKAINYPDYTSSFTFGKQISQINFSKFECNRNSQLFKKLSKILIPIGFSIMFVNIVINSFEGYVFMPAENYHLM